MASQNMRKWQMANVEGTWHAERLQVTQTAINIETSAAGEYRQ